MFTKAWNFLQSRFGPKVNPPQPLDPALQPFKGTLDPHSNSSPKVEEKRLVYSLVQSPPNNKVIKYEIQVENDQELKERMKNKDQDLEYTHQVIDDLRQLQQQIQKMSIQCNKLYERQSQVKIIDHQKPTKNIRQSLTSNESYIRSQYVEDVIQFLGCKYHYEKKDYPQIPYPIYREVYLYWKDRKKGEGEIKTTSLESVKKLTYKSLGLIDQGQWLNDDIVSIYIQLMEKQLTKDTKYKLLNSFFATTTLTKTENMILRVLKKKNVDKTNIIILPVNYKNHWYFVKIQPHTMTIYDSLSNNQSLANYLENPIIKNILKFGKNLYEGELQPEICKTFPQQFNGYDCGVFMLMGIKDVVREVNWNFMQGDINYKRIQLACETLTEKLMLNEDMGVLSNN